MKLNGAVANDTACADLNPVICPLYDLARSSRFALESEERGAFCCLFPDVQGSPIKYYIGLDFGTSGVRACVIDDDKSIVWEQHVAYADPVGQTPEEWRGALHTLLSALPKDIAGQLRGLAVDGTSGTVLLCDTELIPVSPALLYNDPRAQQQSDWLKSISPDGSAPPALARFLWLMQQHDIELAAHFMHQADWLTALLTGQPGISDYHNALKTGYDVEHHCWPDWVKSLPHAHLLPTVFAPGEIIGNIRPDIAAHFGIHPQCAVHAGTTDSNAAFIATGVTHLGAGVTSLGSTLVLKQLSMKRIDAPEYGVYSHRFGDLWLVGGASNAGAGALRQYFEDAQLAVLSARIDPLRDSPLDYYPLTKSGERFPINDAYLAPRVNPRPFLPGSAQAVDQVEFLHGLLQGLARIELAGYERLAELGAPKLTRVVTCGGGAKNTVWATMRSRLIGVPVSAANNSEAAYGAALLCRGDYWRSILSN